MNRMFSYIKRKRENEDNRHINKFTSNPKEIYSLPQFSVRTMTSPWSKGMVAIEIEHAVHNSIVLELEEQLYLQGREGADHHPEMHHCTPAPGHSFLSIPYWPETSSEAAQTLILTPTSCFSVILKGLVYETTP